MIVDDRGNIFLDTQHDGLYVLRCTVDLFSEAIGLRWALN